MGSKKSKTVKANPTELTEEDIQFLVKNTHFCREQIQEWTGDTNLKGESNIYYDPRKCGIGYHGDGERKKVFAARFGAAEQVPLYFQWFQNSEPVGERMHIPLADGDMYAMSEKAVGFDWLKKKIPTLRHAAGCDKFTVIKHTPS